MDEWTLIKVIGDIVAVLLVLALTGMVFSALVIALGFIVRWHDDRQKKPITDEPITQVRVTVPRRQDVPDAFYRAFEP